MKVTYRLVGSISALAGILLMILLLINCILIRDDFLNTTNSKYKVHKNLSITEEELENVVHQMIGFVKGQENSPQVEVLIKGEKVDFFNTKEIGHLEDVKILMRNLYISMWCMSFIFVGGVGFLVYKKNYEAISKGIFVSWGILVVASIFVGILAVIDIDIVVTAFHEIFLSGSQWVLNPALDRSVWMFRTRMYGDVILTLGLIVGVVACISLAIALGVFRIYKKKGDLYGKSRNGSGKNSKRN